MYANLNIEVINTAAYSPFQNGICERNHAVVDDCVAKILEDQPKLNLEIALAWAVNAKNSLSMAESSERIRALRHKIRASGECFQHGERVYYKGDDDNRCKGPRTVLGQDGKVVFVRHGSIYVRVHPCRLIRCETEFSEGKPTQLNGSQQMRAKNPSNRN
ncbi:unnamed protein product [Mytilus coruscus]|uniref:Integrase catalytic domain-containing protein n=1 Tax=Mytilus coruscus TaxID=42192 RepID=A0A6J8B6Y9_MYTCO|nr:unnamed protein product [Mytilus coruscus]